MILTGAGDFPLFPTRAGTEFAKSAGGLAATHAVMATGNPAGLSFVKEKADGL